ncbi:protein N-lysine methyltransferase METTL21A [Pyrus ussuriensis x Pyrus communis]|uniref:Protein N-lysine methyltransferase METTL21A n=1 Tax=Pyrus ussuriensis x Pyrus communis TaxID=2448454 RepID=A0A5N5I1R9_9ROSA|nr:protein N-lysine methyltransferase METTL21A [Pyrus ussuriensis x Pyrus communis]
MTTGTEEVVLKEEEEERMVRMGSYGGMVRLLTVTATAKSEEEEEEKEKEECSYEAAAEEIMLLWGIQQPTLSKPNAFVSQACLELKLDACGHSLSIFQSPSSLNTPGVTGAVMWDSGVVLGKFLEHASDAELLPLQGKKVVALGSGCGLVGCIAALLGGQVVLTDLPDRLRLLRKNIEVNLRHGDMRGSAKVMEFTWGDDPDPELTEPPPDLVLGSDVIYSEEAVLDLLSALQQLSGGETTIFLAGELRNDAVLEYFLECAMKDFVIGRLDQRQWHPEYCSSRVVLYVLVRK